MMNIHTRKRERELFADDASSWMREIQTFASSASLLAKFIHRLSPENLREIVEYAINNLKSYDK